MLLCVRRETYLLLHPIRRTYTRADGIGRVGVKAGLVLYCRALSRERELRGEAVEFGEGTVPFATL